jgi:uncharacterized membrane protein
MNAKLKVLAVTFSVTLNVAFMAAYAHQRLVASAPVVPVFEQLDLSGSERREFERHREDFHELVARLGGQLKSAQLELIDLVARPHLDRTAIAAKQGEIGGLQGSIQSAVIEHLIQQAAILDQARRARFFALLKARVQATDPARPPWMRPPGTDRRQEP